MASNDETAKRSRFEQMVIEKLEARRREAATQAEPSTVIEQPATAGANVDSNADHGPLFVPDDNKPAPTHAETGKSKKGAIQDDAFSSGHQNTNSLFGVGSYCLDSPSINTPSLQNANSPAVDLGDRSTGRGEQDFPTKNGTNKTDDAPETDPPRCTCAISSNCPLAAKKGVKDCRTSLAPVYARNKPKTQKDAQPRKFISTKERARIKRSNEDALYALTLFNKSLTAAPRELNGIFDNMRSRVHKLQFLEIGPESKHIVPRFLNMETGMPAIANAASVPYDIKLDIEMLRFRWERDDFDTDLVRGVIVKTTDTTESSGGTASLWSGVSRSLDAGYEHRLSSDFVGEGHLRNGQWFPLQITAVRDGAHGEIEAGISGHNGIATSLILNSPSSKRSYADIDEGNTVSYCGTRGKDGRTSHGTQLLLESEKKNSPIRLLRGSKLGNINPYRPEAGLRYDGVYMITGHEVIEEESQLYRFKLQRTPGQPPIRHKGKEARPTQEEKAELEAVQNHLAGIRRGFDKKRKRN